jgi:cation transport ATPase
VAQERLRQQEKPYRQSDITLERDMLVAAQESLEKLITNPQDVEAQRTLKSVQQERKQPHKYQPTVIKQQERDWGLIFWWTLATMIGIILGVVVGDSVSSAMRGGDVFSYSITDATLIIIGSIGFSGGQWLILRRHISDSIWWILATTIGVAVGGAIASSTFGNIVYNSSIFMAIAMIGFAVGVAQWLVLRRQITKGGWWIAITTVSLPLSFAVGNIVGFPVFNVAGTAVSGGMLGIISAFTLEWLLRTRRKTKS